MTNKLCYIDLSFLYYFLTQQQTIRTTVWTKHDSRIRSDELTEQHDMEENDQNEIRQRHHRRRDNSSNNDGDDNAQVTMEMAERKSSTRDGDAGDNSRVPLMSRNALYSTSSSNDSMTNPG